LLNLPFLRSERIVGPPTGDSGLEKYDILSQDGICGVQEIIHPGKIYINKQIPTNTNNSVQDLSSQMG